LRNTPIIILPVSGVNKMATTSGGLIALLKRKGIEPTGDRVKDLALAAKVMPKPFRKANDTIIRSASNKD